MINFSFRQQTLMRHESIRVPEIACVSGSLVLLLTGAATSAFTHRSSHVHKPHERVNSNESLRALRLVVLAVMMSPVKDAAVKLKRCITWVVLIIMA